MKTMTLRMLTLSLLFLPTVACSEPVGPPQIVQLTVTLSEAELMWKALRKLPVEEVELLMGKIRQQVTEQTAPKPPEQPK